MAAPDRDITDATYKTSKDVNSFDSNPRTVKFNPTGTKMYLLGTTNDSIKQFSCSTAFDCSTASDDSVSLSVNQDGNPYDFDFADNGKKIYVAGNNNGRIYQYNLTTGWDLSTGSYANKNYSVSSCNGIYVKEDGTKFYVNNSVNRTIIQYSMSTAYDISTGSADSKTFSTSTQDTNPTGLDITSDGYHFYWLGTTDTVFQNSMSTPWDISTGSYDNKSLSINSKDDLCRVAKFNIDGTELYVVGGRNDTIYQYSLPSLGWTGKINGVTDPAKINGIAVADISKVNGVE